MIQSIGLSVLTQVLASGGTFIVNIFMLRVLSLDLFGLYVLLNLFAGTCSQIVNAACGNVYHLLRPMLEVQKRQYEQNYNTLHMLVLAPVSALGVAACLIFSQGLGSQLGVAALFIVSICAVQSLKLQATADGRHELIFKAELLRQTALIAIVAAIAWDGQAALAHLLLAHALTGLLACACIMIGIRWRMSFRRLGWVTRRHFRYARYLVPSTLITSFPLTAIWLLVGAYFGPEALGVLRAAELPFSVLNPLKSALPYFLPQAIYRVEKTGSAGSRQFMLNSGAGLLLLLLVCLSLWAMSILVYPFLTLKDYPAAVGLVFACAYFFFTVIAVTETYLNILKRPDLVFNQNILGAIAAVAVFYAMAFVVGYPAGAFAFGAAALAMALYGIFMLTRHWKHGM